MTKKQQQQSHDYENWYDVWMKQSKEFFSSAEKNLNDMFKAGAAINPEENLKQIHLWLDDLKKQWEIIQLNEQQRIYADYWRTMATMSSEAADHMLKEWIRRSRENEPIHNIHDLYELWLNSCHEIYQKTLRTQTYQDTYSEFMNAAFKFWENYLPKTQEK